MKPISKVYIMLYDIIYLSEEKSVREVLFVRQLNDD
jgi:hypothetical protein